MRKALFFLFCCSVNFFYQLKNDIQESCIVVRDNITYIEFQEQDQEYNVEKNTEEDTIDAKIR